jgi:hypothetical protein
VTTPSDKTVALTPWWGGFALRMGEVLHFRIGPCALWVERLARELRVTHKQHEDPLDTALEVGATSAAAPDEPGLDAARYAVSDRITQIELEPALADRPVVVRTHEPFHVLGGHEATLYLTTPVWVRLSAGEQGKRMFERPCHRPSDTWFGPSTREGELCYAGTTTARLSLDELTQRPGRAVTRVHIVNQAQSLLALDRINVPAPALSVFASAQHRLWTEPLEVRREHDGAIRGVTIARGPAAEAKDTVLLSGPRQSGDQNPFSRAFKALLG